MSAPVSEIRVCSGVRLNSRYEHSIWFTSADAQSAYFASKRVATFNACTYLRRNWDLKLPTHAEQADTWDYLYFWNGETGKRYYYFINSVEYQNNGMTVLHLELDVLQTYMFDYQLLRCFVERQHVADDILGKYTLDEGLELGELVDNGRYDVLLQDCVVLTLSTFNPNYTDVEKPIAALGYDYGRVFSGLALWASNDFNAVRTKLELLNDKGFLEGVLAMWMYPKNLVTLGGEETWSNDNVFKVVHPSAAKYTVPGGIDCGFMVDGYQPQNNKLLSYPFNMLYASNNNGGSATYRFERFNGAPAFSVFGSTTADGTAKLVPDNYNGSSGTGAAWDYGLTLGGFPQCAWESDVYKMWLAQNQNQQAHQQKSAVIAGAAGIAAAIGSAATGNVLGTVGGLGTVYGAYQQIQGMLAQRADMEIQPPQSRGSFSSTVNMGASKQTFSLFRKSVSAENARVIDNYFTMYGYKLNELRKPNPAERDTFTYIKTVGCHIAPKDSSKGICNEDACKIESIFDKGITWWMDGNNICNYSIADRPVVN